MNHFKKGGKVALLGENYFPPMNNSHMSNRRGKGLQRIMEAIIHYKPSVMYICPTKGVNINLLPLLLVNGIPVRLVFPSKSFFSTLNEDEKCILDMACHKADKVIILSQHKCDPLRWSDDWYRASKKVVENSDWVLVAHNMEDVTESFSSLLEKFDGNPKPVLAIDFGEEAQYQ
tara:strand:+ start:485 stop:1006 length:522 start_codon:yes stop_codon:yes gene_type:complete